MSKKEKITILIEGAGTATCISLLKGLTMQDEFTVRTVVIDMDENNAGRYMADAFYKTVGSKNENYVDTVLTICKKESVDIYIPIIDYGFQKLSNARQQFEEAGIYIMIAGKETIDICADKLNTYEFFKSIDIPTAKSKKAVSTDEEMNALSYPLLIKPRTDGRASLGVYIINNEEEFRFHTRENNNYIIQDVIIGREFTVDCLSTLDGKELVAQVVRERTETKAGVSVKAQIVESPLREKIEEYIEKITIRLAIPGICNIQGFITTEGEIFISEINPRSAGTHAFSIQAGLNSIHRLLQLHQGASATEVRKNISINTELRMIRFWDELFIDGESAHTWNNLLK